MHTFCYVVLTKWPLDHQETSPPLVTLPSECTGHSSLYPSPCCSFPFSCFHSTHVFTVWVPACSADDSHIKSTWLCEQHIICSAAFLIHFKPLILVRMFIPIMFSLFICLGLGFFLSILFFCCLSYPSCLFWIWVFFIIPFSCLYTQTHSRTNSKHQGND